jgi:hypothetical protein
MKSFADILKKRVRKGNSGKIELDFHTVKKATEDVIGDIFGDIGKKNIQVKIYKEGQVYLKIFKSIWKTEVNLNRGLIIGKLQEKLKSKDLKGIKISNR